MLIELEETAPSDELREDELQGAEPREAEEETEHLDETTAEAEAEQSFLGKVFRTRYFLFYIGVPLSLYLLQTAFLCVRYSYYKPPLNEGQISNLKNMKDYLHRKYRQYVFSPDKEVRDAIDPYNQIMDKIDIDTFDEQHWEGEGTPQEKERFKENGGKLDGVDDLTDKEQMKKKRDEDWDKMKGILSQGFKVYFYVPMGIFILPFLLTLLSDGKRFFTGAHIHKLAEEAEGELYFITPGVEAPLTMTFLANGEGVAIELPDTDEFREWNED